MSRSSIAALVAGVALTASGCAASVTGPTTIPTTATRPVATTAAATLAGSPGPAAGPQGTLVSLPPTGRIVFVVEGGPSNLPIYVDPSGLHAIPNVADKTLAHAVWASASSLLFDSERDGDRQHLFRMDLDGTNVKQLTSGGANELRASVSADGSTIAYESFTDSNGGQDLGLHVAQADGTKARPITAGSKPGETSGDSYASISPDGTWIVFTHGTDFTTLRAGLWLVHPDGTGLHRLTDDVLDGGYPRWSPDGKTILFTQHYDSNVFAPGPLWVIPAAGGTPRALTDPADPGWSFEGDWSPDGQHVVFTYFRPGWDHNEIHMVNADGSNQSTVWISADGFNGNTPDWGP